MTTTPRPAELPHTKKCLAESLICVIENERDDEHISDIGFILDAQDNFLSLALEYLNDGTKTCLCPPWEG